MTTIPYYACYRVLVKVNLTAIVMPTAQHADTDAGANVGDDAAGRWSVFGAVVRKPWAARL